MRVLQFGVFAVVATLVLLLAHRYGWRRVVRDTGFDGALRRLGTAVLTAGGLLVPSALVLSRMLPRGAVQPLAVAAYCWLGGLFYMTLLLVPWDVGSLVRRIGTWWSSRRSQPAVAPPDEVPPAPDRRTFLARVAAGTAFAGTGGLIAVGVHNALGEISRPEIPVRLPRLPGALSGMRIVQVSDIHIGPILDGRFIRTIVSEVNRMKPDLVVITGDLVDSSVAFIGPDVAPLAELRSRWGTYFVTGNHEYYSGPEQWIAFLRKHGIGVLTNERVSVGDPGPRGASFDLVGTPDTQAGRLVAAERPDLPRALEGRDPERELVLLAHRPDAIHDAAAAGVGLQLSGHTHGGQIWPFGAAAMLASPYLAGLHQHTPLTQIYVSRGTGFWGPPMRIMAPAEITSIILTA